MPAVSPEPRALTLERPVDVLVLERTVNRIIYGNGSSNGYHHGSSSGFLYESLDWRPASSQSDSDAFMEDNADVPATTSRLSTLLGPAAIGAGAGAAAAAAFSTLVGLGEDPSPASNDFEPGGPDDFLPEPTNQYSNYDDEEILDEAEDMELPSASRANDDSEERDRSGERSILPGRYLTPGVTSGNFLATTYVPRGSASEDRYEEPADSDSRDSNSSGDYEDSSDSYYSSQSRDSERGYDDDRDSSYGDRDPMSSEDRYASEQRDDEDDFFPEEVPARAPDPEPESRSSFIPPDAGAAIVAGSTAFAAGAALAAARTGGASGGDDFFSTVPGAVPSTLPPPGVSSMPGSTEDEFLAAPAAAVKNEEFLEPPSRQKDPPAFLNEPPPAPPKPAEVKIPEHLVPAATATATATATVPPVPETIKPAPQPQIMDFFAATGGGFFSAEREVLPQAEVPAPTSPMFGMQSTGLSDSMVGDPMLNTGGTASIIQNAIQAAQRAASSQQSTVVDMPGLSEDSPSSESSKKDKKRKSRSGSSGGAKDKDKDKDDSEAGSKSKGTSRSSSSSKSRSSSVTKKEVDEKTSKPGGSKSKLASVKSKSGSKRSTGSKPESFSMGGLSGPKKAAVIAACVVFLMLPVVVFVNMLGNTIGSITGMASGATGGGKTHAMSLNGTWQIAYRNVDGSQVNGIMKVGQRGDTIEGWGSDLKGTFQVGGKLAQTTNGKVQLTMQKQYISQQNQPLGKPIVYVGIIDGVNPNGPYFMHISGIWTFEKSQGYSWRRQIIKLQGQWEAALTQPSTEAVATAGGPGGQQAGRNPMGGGASGGTGLASDPQKAQQFFMTIALVMLGLGAAIVALSLKIFGPSGYLNVKAKKEYIPSQFKGDHLKMVKEMGGTLRAGGVPVGTRRDWSWMQFWMPKQLNLTPAIRDSNPHVLIIGQGAKGKSRLMASMISHDILSADRAVVVVDSDGSLVDLMMNWIASHPKGKQISERVIVIDPTRDGDNMCYNPLEFPQDEDLQNAASSIVFGFKAIYTEPPGAQSQWNQQTANILRNCAILLMANGKTLTDLPVLLSDNDQRDLMLEKVERMRSERTEYTTLIDAWTNYKRLARTDQWINWIEPILNRVQPMLGDPRIRPILTKAQGDLNLREVITKKQILFVKIPQGQLDQNGNLLGSLIITGVKQAALSLSKSHDKRHPCALYLDELDNFIEKETFDSITTETRKFQVGLCSVAKTLQGLPEDYRNQIIANIGTMAVFSLTKKDGDMLGPQMFRVDGRKVKHQTITNVFNKVNSSPQFELISDEEKLNIDRVVAQDERSYFFYRVGTVAGVFNMKAPDFPDVEEKDINYDLIDIMYENRQEDLAAADEDDDDGGDEDDDDE